jgi:hypothetical protein
MALTRRAVGPPTATTSGAAARPAGGGGRHRLGRDRPRRDERVAIEPEDADRDRGHDRGEVERRGGGHVLGELAGDERRDRAAAEAHEAVGRRGDRPLDRGGLHHELGHERVDDAEERAGDDDAHDERRLRCMEYTHQAQKERESGESRPQAAHVADAARDRRGDEHREHGEHQAPPEEDVAELVGPQTERERRVGEQREEAEVVEDRREAARPDLAMAEGAERLEHRDALARVRLRRPVEEDRGGDEADGHEHGDAEERAAPADRAELPAEQRPDGDAEAERGLVEHHGARDPAAGRADDHRQRGGDEEGVAEPPPGAQPDDRADAVRRTREGGEHDDERQAGKERALRADAAGDRARDEHRDPGDGEVAGEQELDLAR